jgi:CPA1 family monovalent cation:H+ antiporter
VYDESERSQRLEKSVRFFNIIAILIVISSLFAYINFRFIRLPSVIGVMLVSIFVSLGLVLADQVGLGIARVGENLLRNIDFNNTLMVWMLGFLLFAGALHVELNELHNQKWNVLIFSTVGVILSTLSIGTLMYFILIWIGIPMKYIYCLLFGALISPTDPVAVMDLLRTAGAPKPVETAIAGESLFNDGIGVVIFTILYGLATGGHAFSSVGIGLLFVRETFGGAILGLALGGGAYWLLKSIDNYQVEILLTLALVVGGYAFAITLHTSGPITIVVAGLLIGNQGRKFAMSDQTRERLTMFWDLVDQILNSILFVLIGLELLAVTFSQKYILAGAAAVPIALSSRYGSLALPQYVLRLGGLPSGALKILTWGGLRGGIAVALALSLPLGQERNLILTMTYMMVVFSIVVQGLTMKFVLTRGALKTIQFEVNDGTNSASRKE